MVDEAEGAKRKVTRVPKEKRDPALLCIRLNSRGEPCGAYRIKGGTMCARHSTKLIKQKAEQRYWDLLPTALTELAKVLRQTDVADANKVRSIVHIVERTLGTVAQHVDVNVQAEWEGTFDGVTDVAWSEDAETKIAALEAELRELRNAARPGAQPALEARRAPDRDDRGEVLEGRVLDEDEPWPPRR